MTTNTDISKEIEKLTGYKGIKVSKSNGVCRFYCEDNKDLEQGIDLSLIDSQYIPRLNMFTASEWAVIFKNEIE